MSALILALPLAIAACTKPHSPPPADSSETTSPHRFVDVPTGPSFKEKTRMSESASTVEDRHPAIPVAELRERIIDLVGGLQSLKSLEWTQVENALKAPLLPDPATPERHRGDGRTREGWGYDIAVDRFGGPDTPPIVSIGMDEDFDNAHRPTYCTIAFEPMAEALVAKGYAQATTISTFKGRTWWNFQKKLPQSSATVFVETHLYHAPGEGSGPYCIKSIRISAE